MTRPICSCYGRDASPDCPAHGTRDAAKVTITLDRRELASILAAVQLLRWANTAMASLPYNVGRMIDVETTNGDTIERLSDAELRDLARRLA